MNDFTKDELIEIAEYCNWEPLSLGHSDFRKNLWLKLQYMIDNYRVDVWNRKKIAESHLQEASSLISHAMGILEMEKDE
jgi:hypothetical protein